MYVALNGTLTTGGKLSWPEFAKLAARTGYLGVDVNLGAAMQAGTEATQALLAELRLKPAVVGLPVEFRKDDTAFQQGLEKLAPAARFSALIGCPRMSTWIMSSTDTPKAELWKIYRSRFAACANVLGEHGVRLGLEFLGPLHLRTRSPHEFIWRMEEMVEFAKECGPNVGVLLDSWHWHHAGGTLKNIIDAGKSRIVHVQVADAPKLPPEEIKDSERLMPGEGIIDFRGFFGALKKIGYADGVSPEIFGRGLKEMPPEQGAALGLKTTTAVMRKAGVLS
jgi:sugar phosphate isomerase/epimerase